MALRKFIIERDIPGAGSLEREQLRGAAAKSNGVLRELGPDIQWVESYVAADKTFADTSGMAVFQQLIADEWTEGDGPQRRAAFDPRVVSSFVMLMISIWDFYAPYMQQVDDWGDRDLGDVHAEVLELMQTLVSAAAPRRRASRARTP